MTPRGLGDVTLDRRPTTSALPRIVCIFTARCVRCLPYIYIYIYILIYIYHISIQHTVIKPQAENDWYKHELIFHQFVNKQYISTCVRKEDIKDSDIATWYTRWQEMNSDKRMDAQYIFTISRDVYGLVFSILTVFCHRPVKCLGVQFYSRYSIKRKQMFRRRWCCIKCKILACASLTQKILFRFFSGMLADLPSRLLSFWCELSSYYTKSGHAVIGKITQQVEDAFVTDVIWTLVLTHPWLSLFAVLSLEVFSLSARIAVVTRYCCLHSWHSLPSLS